MNFRHINWNETSTDKGPADINYQFIETIRDCFLHQHVSEPTRGRGNATPSTLDLLFSNEENMIEDVNIMSPLGKSDHAVIEFVFVEETATKNSGKIRYKYEKADYYKMNQQLDIDWEQIMSNKTVDEQWNLFKDSLKQAIQNCTPMQKNLGDKHTKDRKYASLDKKSKTLINRKQRLWKKLCTNPDDTVRAEYNIYRNKVRRISRRKIKIKERNIALQIKENPKIFWKYVQTKTKTSIPDLYLTEDKDTLTSTDQDKANVLADFFSSVFTKEEENPDLPEINYPNIPCLEEIDINEEIIEEKLEKLKLDKSPGPDGIPPRVLKETRKMICRPLTILFRNSFDKGECPKDWKNAEITAIYKKGDKKYAGNYRPVSLTCIVCKLMETVIRENVMDHIKTYKLLSNKQYGFISGRSTTLQLLTVLDRWTQILDEGGCIDIAYCDFMKAFDKVPHLRMLHKLSTYALGESYINWTKAFLLSRTQKVIINGISSSDRHVTSGIPQGSVLGPLLFVLYINDMPDSVLHQSEEYLYADDTKIFRGIYSEEDCHRLQNDIHLMCEWSERWLLKFHPDKCKVMRISRSKTEVPLYEYTLKPDEKSMEYSESEKDVGVIIDNKLSFENHINEKINKANSIMGVIRRTFEYLDPQIFRILYISMVRPHIEYANAVWNPYLKKHIDSLENVQRRATKLVPGLTNLSYMERLKRLHLPTLSYRRSRGDMIEAYKILSGKYDPDVPQLLETCESEHRTRGHQLKLQKISCHSNVRQNSFRHRVCNMWNSLPQTVVSAPTVQAFEARLDRFWKQQPQLLNHRADISTKYSSI